MFRGPNTLLDSIDSAMRPYEGVVHQPASIRSQVSTCAYTLCVPALDQVGWNTTVCRAPAARLPISICASPRSERDCGTRSRYISTENHVLASADPMFVTVTTTVAAEAIHWSFGALTGAAYGALAEYYPAATGKDGAAFGMALTSLTHGGALPAMGLSAEPQDQKVREKTSEMATHVVYGMVTETVRRFVRKMLA